MTKENSQRLILKMEEVYLNLWKKPDDEVISSSKIINEDISRVLNVS